MMTKKTNSTFLASLSLDGGFDTTLTEIPPGFESRFDDAFRELEELLARGETPTDDTCPICRVQREAGLPTQGHGDAPGAGSMASPLMVGAGGLPRAMPNRTARRIAAHRAEKARKKAARQAARQAQRPGERESIPEKKAK